MKEYEWVYNGHFWVKETPQAKARIFDHVDSVSWDIETQDRRALADSNWIDWRYCEGRTWKSARFAWWTLDCAEAFCDLLLSGEVGVRRVNVPNVPYNACYFYFEPEAKVRTVIPNYKATSQFANSEIQWDLEYPSIMDHWKKARQLRLKPEATEKAEGRA